MQAYQLHLPVTTPFKEVIPFSANDVQGVTRQTSSLSQPSSNSLSPGLNGQQPSAMKVKIYFGDDLIAIKVPTDVQFDQLYEKIRERLKIPQQEDISLKYRDEASGKSLAMTDNEQLDVALRDNDKLILYVNYN